MPRIIGSSKPSSWNDKERTIEVIASTGARVLRRTWSGDYYEELAMNKENIDFTRLEQGAVAVLNSHSRWSLSDQLGTVISHRLEKDELIFTLKFSERDDVSGFVKDISEGLIRNVSIGYSVRKMQEIQVGAGETPVWRAIDWCPTELSFVPVGADPSAGVRAFEDATPDFIRLENKEKQGEKKVTEEEKKKMIDEAIAAERARSSEIHLLTSQHGLGAEFSKRHLEYGTSIEQVRMEILNELATRSKPANGSNIQIGQDEVEKSRLSAEAYLEHRIFGASDKPDANRWKGRRLEEVARSLQEIRGIKTDNLDLHALAERSFHTTSDLAISLSNVMGKSLRKAYEFYPQQFEPITTSESLSDWKEKYLIQTSSVFALEEKSQGGPMKSETMSDAQEKMKLKTYAISVSFSREMLGNDDLSVLSKAPQNAARGLSILESDKVWNDIFKTNQIMMDGKPLFHADHFNLSPKAMPLDVNGISIAVANMRAQTGLRKTELLNLVPETLIVPPSLELQARRLLATNVQPVTSDQVNVYGGMIKNLIIEPRLEGMNKWFLAASKSQIDLIALGYLDGQRGLKTSSKYDDELLAITFRFYTDFAARAIDWRGFYAVPIGA